LKIAMLPVQKQKTLSFAFLFILMQILAVHKIEFNNTL